MELAGDSTNFLLFVVVCLCITFILYEVLSKCDLELFTYLFPYSKQMIKYYRNKWRLNIQLLFVDRKIWKTMPFTAFLLFDGLFGPFLIIGVTIYVLSAEVSIEQFIILLCWCILTRMSKIINVLRKNLLYVFFVPLLVISEYYKAFMKIYASLTIKEFPKNYKTTDVTVVLYVYISGDWKDIEKTVSDINSKMLDILKNKPRKVIVVLDTSKDFNGIKELLIQDATSYASSLLNNAYFLKPIIEIIHTTGKIVGFLTGLQNTTTKLVTFVDYDTKIKKNSLEKLAVLLNSAEFGGVVIKNNCSVYKTKIIKDDEFYHFFNQDWNDKEITRFLIHKGYKVMN